MKDIDRLALLEKMNLRFTDDLKTERNKENASQSILLQLQQNLQNIAAEIVTTKSKLKKPGKLLPPL